MNEHTTFYEDLREVITKHDLDRRTSTPEHVLALHLVDVVDGLAAFVRDRDSCIAIHGVR